MSTIKNSHLLSEYAPKHITNLTKEVADINLFDEIGNGAISGQAFADEIQMLNNFGVKEIRIHINSPGGVIMDGFSIFSAIFNSEATVNTIIEGVAASISGIIALAGDKVSIFDFAKMMVHGPSGSDNPDEKEQNAINSMKDSLSIILKNRTNKNKDDVAALMDVETWFTAKEALEAGLVDEIISTKIKKEKKKRQNVAEILNILNINKPEKMKNVCLHLNLSEDASEQSILDAIKKIEDKLTAKTSSLETKEAEVVKANETIENQKTTITGFENKQAELNKTMVVDAVEKGIKDNIFDEKDKDTLVEKFENNYEGLKLIVGSIKTPAQIITDKLSDGSGGKAAVLPEDKKDWGWRKLEVNAPELANKIRNSNKELFKKMYEDEYDGVKAPTE